MSQYYKPNRVRNLYDPNGKEPFRLSRGKIDSFIKCPRCFYLDRRLGVGQPPGYPFSLNSAVDALLKREFDYHRERGTQHELMREYGVDAVPFKHEKIDEWRDSLRRGVTYKYPKSNLLLTGGVDDVWVKPDGELIIVDYKATSKQDEVTLDAEWQDGYKRQMEIYQWLFRKNGFRVATTGYFVYCNGDAGMTEFHHAGGGSRPRLEFDIKLIPYDGDDSWIEAVVQDLYKCLQSNELPASGEECDFCAYREAVREVEK